MRYLTGLLVVLLSAAPLLAPADSASHRFGDRKVYVCVSKRSVAYHTSPTCGGLGQCTHIVRSVTPAVALKLGKRACHLCYPDQATRPGGERLPAPAPANVTATGSYK